MNTGIALVPARDDILRLIILQKRLLDVAELSPILSTEANLPHITILQGKTPNPICSPFELEELLKTAISRDQTTGLFVTIKSLQYVSPGWYFLTIHHNPVIHALHNNAFSLCKKRLFVNQHDLTKDLSGYTERQKKNYLRYGYRFIGKDFSPHFTLGRTPNKKPFPQEALLDSIASSIIKNRLRIDKLTLYVMGENGSHTSQLSSITLPTP